MAKQIQDEGYEIGAYSYGMPTVHTFLNSGTLKIGKFCSIASDVSIFLGGEHRTEWVTTYPFSVIKHVWPEVAEAGGHPRQGGDVHIGNDVWLSNGCTILSGVRIGHGAVIGAKALVARDVDPYSIVGGNPARVIRKRFDDDVIARLLRIAWWDWPEAELRQVLPAMMSDDIRNFVDLADRHLAAVLERRVDQAREVIANATAVLKSAEADLQTFSQFRVNPADAQSAS